MLTLGNGLYKRCENERQVVAGIEAVPERTRDEGCQCGPEAGLLALGCHAEVHVVLQPVVGVDVPETQISTSILRALDLQRHDVGKTIPFRTIGLWVDAIVADTREDA
jgi:hypothetical protein